MSTSLLQRPEIPGCSSRPHIFSSFDRFWVLVLLILVGFIKERSSQSLPLYMNNYDVIKRQYSIDMLNNESYATYCKMKSRVNETFVCLSPHARQYGGWGNVVFYAFTLMELGLAFDRVPIMNHALVNAMYNHPDDRQNWSLLSIKHLDKIKDSVQGLTVCRGLNERTIASFPKMFGLHGCPENYNMNDDIWGHMTALYKKYFPAFHFNLKGKRKDWVFNNLLIQWIFSNPRKVWKDALSNYRNKMFGDENAVADWAIQIRSWRDLGGQDSYEKSAGPCIASCVIASISNFTKILPNKKDFKIFVTGDNISLSSCVSQEIKNWGIENNLTIHTFSDNVTLSSSWHSVDITNNGRREISFKDSVEHNIALLDWDLFSEAKFAVYTVGSGFSSWARMKGGIDSQFCDRVSGLGDKGACVCDEVLTGRCSNEFVEARNNMRAL